MNKTQQIMLLGIWGHARKALREQGLSAADADAQRAAITVKALGRTQSWGDAALRDWSEEDVDKVKAELLAITRPADLGAQLGQLDQPCLRKRWKIGELLRQLGKPAAYADGIATRMHREGKIAAATVEGLREEGDLGAIVIALENQRRRERRKGKALQELQEELSRDPEYRTAHEAEPDPF